MIINSKKSFIMKNYYYILTTEEDIRYFDFKEAALDAYKFAKQRYNHVRLEVANKKWGTARVIRQKNNIWK